VPTPGTRQNIYTEYPDPRRDEWQTKILPAFEENTRSCPYETEQEIPFHADKSAGSAQPTTLEKPTVARVKRP